MRLDKGVLNAAMKVMLRTFPLVPGPELFELIISIRRSEKDLDAQVREAFDSLSKSSQLISNLEDILKERESKLTALQAEYERISQLSSLTSAQAEAVATSLKAVIGASATRERVYAFLINIVAGLVIFVVGVLLSDWVKGLLHVVGK